MEILANKTIFTAILVILKNVRHEIVKACCTKNIKKQKKKKKLCDYLCKFSSKIPKCYTFYKQSKYDFKYGIGIALFDFTKFNK